MEPCILCGDETGRHEPVCPHFMRGPDPGGDPFEWPTLLDAIAELEHGTVESDE